MKQSGDDGASFNEYSLLEIRQVSCHWNASDGLHLLVVVVVPFYTLGKSERHFLHLECFEGVGGCDYLWSNKHRISKHELCVD